MDKRVIERLFGKIRAYEPARTTLLVCRPYGDITVPDTQMRKGVALCVARAPDEKFYENGYWANWGPKPSDNDPDVFVIPVAASNYNMINLGMGNWQQVLGGDFITTASGVIVLHAISIFAWEGYRRPGKRDYNFDKRRLEKSFTALKQLAEKPIRTG